MSRPLWGVSVRRAFVVVGAEPVPPQTPVTLTEEFAKPLLLPIASVLKPFTLVLLTQVGSGAASNRSRQSAGPCPVGA